MKENFTIMDNGMYYFYADWCAPCKLVKPFIKEFEERGENIERVDADEEIVMAKYFDVMALPTFVSVKNGKENERVTGAVPKEKLEDMLENLKEED